MKPAGGAGDQAGDVRDDARNAFGALGGDLDTDRASLRQGGRIERAQCAARHQVGGGDGGAGMTREADSVGIGILDRAVAGAQEAGERIDYHDARRRREKFRKGHFDLRPPRLEARRVDRRRRPAFQCNAIERCRWIGREHLLREFDHAGKGGSRLH